jgi:hypothetical protein
MQGGDVVNLHFFDTWNDLVFIGYGQTAYAFVDTLDAEWVWLVVPEYRMASGESVSDCSKDVLCEARAMLPDNPYLPDIEYRGSDFVEGLPEVQGLYCRLYRMRHYGNLIRGQFSEAWADMKYLHSIRIKGKNSAYDEGARQGHAVQSLAFLGNEAARLTVYLSGGVNFQLSDALKALYICIMRKSRPGLTFEFGLKDLGVDSRGHLILRDPVYDAEITSNRRKEQESN